MKYKVGDKVRIKSFGWYTENKNNTGYIIFNNFNAFTPEMVDLCGQTIKIQKVCEEFDVYEIVNDIKWYITDDMIEGISIPKQKLEFPKTFEECVSVLMCKGGNRMPLELTNTFRKLIDARNAYWTIYSEENGLEKPWELDWNDADQKRYVIAYFCGNIEKSRWDYGYSTILTFPTEEVRDAFYENFKKEIEICKELL